jgi:small subunit ribosomal protein S6
MLDPRAGDDQREQVAADTKGRLEAKGTLNHEANWGMRKMAYEIEQRGEADYRFYRFNGGKDLLDELNHTLRITEGVMRFRIFRVEPEAPIMVPPDTEQIMRRDEDDDRGRGRSRRDDRGPRRPRGDDRPPAGDRASAPAAASAPASDSAPDAGGDTPAADSAPEAGAAPDAGGDEAPAEPAPAE